MIEKIADRAAIIVAGMHQFGAIGLARILDMSMGRVPQTHSIAIGQLNDQLLAARGMSWESYRDPSTDLEDPRVIEVLEGRAVELVSRELHDKVLPVIGDARICRVADLWQEAVERCGAHPLFVCVVGDPQTAASSPAHRTGLSSSHSQLLWLRYLLDFEHATRGKARVFVGTDAVLKDWRSVVETILGMLPGGSAAQNNSDEALDVFVADEMHAFAESEDGRYLAPWLQELHDILRKWCRVGECEGDFARLDRLRVDFGQAAPALENLIGRECALTEDRTRMVQLESRLSDAVTSLEALTRKVADADKTLAARDRLLVEFSAELAEARADREKFRDLFQQRSFDLKAIGDGIGRARQGVVLVGDVVKHSMSTLPRGRYFPRIGFLRRRKGRSGRKELLRVIAQSELFERQWYLAENPDVAAEGLDPVAHYLMFGGFEGRDPGPDFNSQWYLDTYVDVVVSGMNPLVHYVLHGKAEGRAIAASYLAEAALQIDEPLLPAVDPLTFPVRQHAQVSWQPLNEIGKHQREASRGVSVADNFLGLVEERADAQDVERDKILSLLDRFCRISGMDPANLLSDSDRDKPAVSLRSDEAADFSLADHVLAFSTSSGAVHVNDAWYLNEFAMRLRLDADSATEDIFVLRAYQFALEGDRPLVCLGEQRVEGAGPSFADFKLSNPFSALLLTLGTPDGRLLSVCVMPFPSLCRGGLHYGELLAAGNECVATDRLRRYSAELVGMWLMATSPLSVGCVEVDIMEATGAERIFSPALHDWLRAVMGVRIVSGQDAPDESTDARMYLEASLGSSHASSAGGIVGQRENGAGYSLKLPADAVPSLYALVSHDLGLPRGEDKSAGSFVVCDDVTGVPRWYVEVPPLGSLLADLRPSGKNLCYPLLERGARVKTGIGAMPSAPLAIRFADMSERDDAGILMPVAIESGRPLFKRRSGDAREDGRISVILPRGCEDVVSFRAFLESLRMQTVADRIELVLGPGNPERQLRAVSVLDSHFPGQYSFADIADRAASGAFLLFADERIVLHDPRTLEVLRYIASRDNVASASCVLVRQASDAKPESVALYEGGVFSASSCSTDGNDAVNFLPDFLQVFPAATYPVAANSRLLFMTRADTWARIGGFGAGGPSADGGNDPAAHETDETLVSLCTSIVSAGFHERDDAPEMGNGAETGLEPAGVVWRQARASVVRGLRG